MSLAEDSPVPSSPLISDDELPTLREQPQLTVRAVLTGMVLGAVLAPANIYAGLKVGWAINMAVSSALISYGFWGTSARVIGTRPMNLLENNVNQVVASAGAMIASAGLVAAVPALTLLTGYEWSFRTLAPWTMTVSLVGIVSALLTRRQLLVVERLPFPSGVATATTLQQMYARGATAHARLKALIAAGSVAALVKSLVEVFALRALPLPGSFALATRQGVRTVTLSNLGFALDPSLLMVGIGVLIGPRAGLSLLLGALLAWGVLAPLVISHGLVDPGVAGATASWFGGLVNWMLWPGVTLMVAAALTSLASSWRSLLPQRRRDVRAADDARDDYDRAPAWARPLAIAFALVVIALSVILQHVLFDIDLYVSMIGTAFTFLLATVAARVTGETDITPIGAMGQVTQLFFGLIAPGNVAANLMAANVTGGAASQCGDLMQDLRSGEMLRASSTRLAIAQVLGVIVGAAAGSASYLLLVPDPRGMLLTEAWPAPAVATWKAAAEVFARGISAMPAGSGSAMAIALVIGVALALAERHLPTRSPRVARFARFVPSPASLGLAFVIPASYSLSMCFGALLALFLSRSAPRFSERLLLVIAAGTMTGESLTGVAFTITQTVRSLLSLS